MFYVITYCVGFVGFLIAILYLYLTRNFNHWKNKSVDFIKPIPFFGNFFKVAALQVCIGEFICEIYKKCEGPFIGFFVFDQPFLLIRDTELIKRCLITDFEYFSHRSIIVNRRDDEIASNFLFVIKNPLWRSVRRKLTSVFATSKIKNTYLHILTASDDLRNYIDNIAVKEEIAEAREIAMKFTTDIIASWAFGINPRCFINPNAEFRKATHRIFDLSFGRKLSMTAYFVAPFLVKLLKLKFLEPNAAEFISGIFSEIVELREKSRGFRGDLIDSLIQFKNNKKPGDYTFDMNMMRDQAINLFMAGFETTGSTIAFTLHELALNPLVQDRVRKEIRTTIEKYGDLSYDAIQDLSYLDMTIKETLRKYPVLPYIDRRCAKPYTIPGTNVVIEKDIPIYISLFGLQMDPEYFPNPEVFDPERFTPKNIVSRPAYCYMPFGEGPRKCIGALFGWIGVKTALFRILNEFEVVPCKETPTKISLDPNGFLIAPKNGIKLNFKRKY